MIKNEKGITLIALIITIIVMLILVSTTVYVGLDTYRESTVTAFVTQMQIIQKKVDTLVSDGEIEIGTIINECSNKVEINNSINNAIVGNEITTWDTEAQNIRYFSKEDIKNILDIENIDYNIIVNFDTREVVSLEGIEYNNTTYYTQYNLLQGQKVSQYDYEEIEEQRNNSTILDSNDIIITRETVVAENITIDNANGLNCIVVIQNIGITNGTLKYKIGDNSWQTISNYTKKEKDYAVQVSKSGTYTFQLIDNASSSISEINKYIEVVNSPKKDQSLGITTITKKYDYSNLDNSENWAYSPQTGTVTHLWIPRLAYQDDTIKFTKGTTNIATDDTYLDDTWTISDVFIDNEGNSLTGIWVEVGSKTGNDLRDLIKQNENL